MTKKEFNIAGYKEVMANFWVIRKARTRFFLKPLILRYRPIPGNGAKVVILISCIPVT